MGRAKEIWWVWAFCQVVEDPPRLENCPVQMHPKSL